MAESGVLRWDSSGISIIVTDGSTTYTPIGWLVDSVPTTVIGAGEDPSTQLYRVQGVRDWGEGGVLVVDGGSRELRFFNAEGLLQFSVGGRGEGPGEFQDPWLLNNVGTDSLFVWDPDLHRLQAFSSYGEDPRVIRMRDWPFGAGWRPPPGVAGHHFLVAMRNILTWTRSQTAGAKEDSVAFVWYEPESGGITALDSLTYSQQFIHLRPGWPPEASRIPFSVAPTAAVSRNGALITSGLSPEIRQYGFDGDLRRILRIDAAARTVTPDMVES